MYTIKQASALTGLPPDTIRAWERRYSLPPPRRSPGGYRLYDDAALRVYQSMQDLLGQGWTPRNAASSALSGLALQHPVLTPEDYVATIVETGVVGAPSAAALQVLFDSVPLGEAIDGWLVPMLEVVGRRWAEGVITVAQEHEISAAVMRRLSVVFEEHPAAGRPRVVIGLLPGCRHEVLLMAFAALARAGGVPLTYLGQDVPLMSWQDASAAGIDVVITAVHSSPDVVAALQLAATLRASGWAGTILAGGSHQEQVGPAIGPLGHALAPAAKRLARLVQGASSETVEALGSDAT